MSFLGRVYAFIVQIGSNFLEFLARAIVWRRKKGIITDMNRRYADGRNTVCDFYYRDSADKKPVLIYIHGGGWVSGTKGLRKFYCYEYVDNGYFVMNINYDYAPKKKFPTQIRQIFKAVEYLYFHADRYNLDMSKIVVAGESAGAYFSSYITAITRKKELYDALGIDFRYKHCFYPAATVLLNGAYDAINLSKIKFLNMGTFLHSFFGVPGRELRKGYKEEYRYFSPMEFINEDYPPTVVGRGVHDGLDPESALMAEKLKEKKVPYMEFMAKGLSGVHGFCIAAKTKEGRRCLDETLSFLSEVIA